MLMTLTLGILIGIAAVTLVRQWLDGALEWDREASQPLPPADFPHLAPGRLSRAPSPLRPFRSWRRAA